MLFIKHAHKLPHELYQSLAWDRGKEESPIIND